MKNIKAALLALPLALTATAFGGDIYTEGDAALGNVSKTGPALVERINPKTGERVVFDASAIQGDVKAKDEASFRTALSDKGAKLEEKQIAVSDVKNLSKDKPTTAWYSVRYYYTDPYYYSYNNYWYNPYGYYYGGWSYTSVTTVTYYGGYYWGYYRPATRWYYYG